MRWNIDRNTNEKRLNIFTYEFTVLFLSINNASLQKKTFSIRGFFGFSLFLEIGTFSKLKGERKSFHIEGLDYFLRRRIKRKIKKEQNAERWKIRTIWCFRKSTKEWVPNLLRKHNIQPVEMKIYFIKNCLWSRIYRRKTEEWRSVK